MLALVLGCFAVGLLAQHLVPAARAARALDRAVLDVALPALILAKLPDLALGADLVVPVGAAWGCLGLAAAAVLVGARRFGWSRQTTGALLLVTPLGNTTFLGLAMVESLLGRAELTRALAFDQLGSFLGLATYGSVIAAHWGHGEGGWRPVLVRLVRFPAFLAVLASFVLRASSSSRSASTMPSAGSGASSSPLAMLALGLRFRIGRDGPTSARRRVWCLGTKMVLLPCAVLAATALAVGRQRSRVASLRAGGGHAAHGHRRRGRRRGRASTRSWPRPWSGSACSSPS